MVISHIVGMICLEVLWYFEMVQLVMSDCL